MTTEIFEPEGDAAKDAAEEELKYLRKQIQVLMELPDLVSPEAEKRILLQLETLSKEKVMALGILLANLADKKIKSAEKTADILGELIKEWEKSAGK